MTTSTTDRRLGVTADKGFKAPVACATTANITLSGEQTIDGVTTSASRVLVKDQTTTSENGLYDSSSAAWSRCIDANGNYDLVNGTQVLVAGGSSNGMLSFVLQGTNPITPGTSAMTWTQAPANSYTPTVHRTEASSTDRTLNFYVQHSKLRMASYCDPTSDTPAQIATALAAAIADAKAGNKAIEFEPGATYETNAGVNFLGSAGLKGLRFWGNGCTLYRNTGAGPVATLDAGATTRCDDIEFEDFILRGQAATSYGLYMRGLMRSRVRARAVDVATAGFKVDWAVTARFHLTVSDNVDTFTVNPATGLILDVNGLTEYVANCKFHVVMESPITGTGVDIIYGGLGNTFTGTCEGIARGLRQRSTAADCILLKMDFEQNTEYDVKAEGRGLALERCNAFSSAVTSPNIVLAATANDTSCHGGFLRQIDLDTAATGTTINDVTVSDNVLLGITGTGLNNWRGSGNVKVDTNRVITAVIPDQLGDTGTFTATLTGCGTSPTSTIDFARVGNFVTLNVPAITATSNSTAATLTGMSTAIYPSAVRSDVGVVTDNGAPSLGRYFVSTSGVITLNVNAATAFTTSGTKGSAACKVTYKV